MDRRYHNVWNGQNLKMSRSETRIFFLPVASYFLQETPTLNDITVRFVQLEKKRYFQAGNYRMKQHKKVVERELLFHNNASLVKSFIVISVRANKKTREITLMIGPISTRNCSCNHAWRSLFIQCTVNIVIRTGRKKRWSALKILHWNDHEYRQDKWKMNQCAQNGFRCPKQPLCFGPSFMHTNSKTEAYLHDIANEYTDIKLSNSIMSSGEALAF